MIGFEGCDDGNVINGDGCNSDCTIQTGYDCIGGTPVAPDTWAVVWGDGINIGETCDDNNIINGDGCSSDWSTVEIGYVWSGGSCKLLPFVKHLI
jgi:cysteine-rich repeat protein